MSQYSNLNSLNHYFFKYIYQKMFIFFYFLEGSEKFDNHAASYLKEIIIYQNLVCRLHFFYHK